MTPRCQAFSIPQANMKRLLRQNERGSAPVGKMNAEPGGADLPHSLRRINRRAAILAQAPHPQA